MSKPCFDLEGKTALVCGASGGLGAACARLMARAGAKLVISGTRDEKLDPLTEEVNTLGGGCSQVAVDLSKEGEPQRLVDVAVERLGRLDILVNAQGINRPQKAEEVTAENWDAVMNINLRSLFFVCQAAGRQMIKQNYGRIVSISSQTGTVALPLRAAYCSSKAAVDSVSRSLALEWAPYNITVNTVAPTFVETDLVAGMFKDPAFKQYVLDNIILGRMAAPEEVGYAVLYLVTDLAAMITGHVLMVDGGWTIK
ncbi:MAG: glucose 1-dehydrogenase [Deltaproteobacteria bacterium]|nr:glucose 1-dehydrogenase [Deltaproteobacteria bacterium]